MLCLPAGDLCETGTLGVYETSTRTFWVQRSDLLLVTLRPEIHPNRFWTIAGDLFVITDFVTPIDPNFCELLHSHALFDQE